MNTEKFFTGLNENQINAIKKTEGFVRIIAGAGSGKTKVLVNRYAYIIEKLGINASNILCVTFTNRAAKEMKSRIQKILSREPVNDFICTFHGFCVRILREDIHKINYPKSFSIIDTEDQKTILREVYQKIEINSSDITFKKSIKIIREYKTKNKYIEKHILNFNSINYNSEAALEDKIVIEYIKLQKKTFSLDFDDLIYFVLWIFLNHNDVLEKWQEKLHYIMVDETQDNSITQWGFVDLLSKKNKNLFVVGDPDQSIYEWRGAIPEKLVNFDNTHTPCETIILNQNYRSTEKILNIANSLIVNNKIRISKDMYTENIMQSKVIHFHARNEQEESEWVVEKIKNKLITVDNLNNFAILYRANFISRAFEQALIKSEIPYVIYGGIRFFERKEIKDSLAYLKLIGTGDDISFLRIINSPSRKLGKVYIDKIKKLAELDDLSLYDTVKKHQYNRDFNKPSSVSFVHMIEDLRKKSEYMSISDLLQLTLEKSLLLESIRLDGDQERLENITELMQSIKNYESTQINEEKVTLIQYLQDIALYTNIDYKNDNDFVKLMTIHQSKGMEFNTVFVVGMSEGIFPSHRSIRDRKISALEEERRLAYVAITRAEKELFLTESEGFNYETGNKYPSRFIYEIRDGLLDVEGEISQDIINGCNNLIKRIDNELLGITQKFNLYDKVIHPFFGEGEIRVIHDESEDPHYEIFFTQINKIKPISLEYTDLKLSQDIVKKVNGFTENIENKYLDEKTKFNLYDKVGHPIFGDGEIRAINDNNENPYYEIFFTQLNDVLNINFDYTDLYLIPF
jgi:DNA helicase-2/ATP-dependent DNA helicase PcrA